MFTLGIISLVMTLASTAVSVYSQVETANAQEDQMKYDAKRAREAGIAKQKALALEADRIASENRAKLSKGINVLSQSGLEISTGSPLMTLSQQHADNSADLNELKRQGTIAYLTGKNQGRMLDTKATSIRRGGYLNAGGAVLNGVGSLASNGYSLYSNANPVKLDPNNSNQIAVPKPQMNTLTNGGVSFLK